MNKVLRAKWLLQVTDGPLARHHSGQEWADILGIRDSTFYQAAALATEMAGKQGRAWGLDPGIGAYRYGPPGDPEALARMAKHRRKRIKKETDLAGYFTQGLVGQGDLDIADAVLASKNLEQMKDLLKSWYKRVADGVRELETV